MNQILILILMFSSQTFAQVLNNCLDSERISTVRILKGSHTKIGCLNIPNMNNCSISSTHSNFSCTVQGYDGYWTDCEGLDFEYSGENPETDCVFTIIGTFDEETFHLEFYDDEELYTMEISIISTEEIIDILYLLVIVGIASMVGILAFCGCICFCLRKSLFKSCIGQRENLESSYPVSTTNFEQNVKKGNLPGRDEILKLFLLQTEDSSDETSDFLIMKTKSIVNGNAVNIRLQEEVICTLDSIWISNLKVEEMKISMPKFIFSECSRPKNSCQFLKMILEHRVKFVVLLSPEKEGEDRDHGYDLVLSKSWLPNSHTKPVTYDEVEIRTSERRTFQHTNKGEERTVWIKGANGETLELTLFQFPNWLKIDSKNSAVMTVDCVKYVKELARKDPSSTIAIHCPKNAYGGEAFLLLYKLFTKIDSQSEGEAIDIFSEVLQLKGDRPQMVQSEEEYKFLYLCVAEYLKQKNVAYVPSKVYSPV